MEMRIGEKTLPKLDPISRATLFRIAFMVLTIGLWLGYSGQMPTDGALASVMTRIGRHNGCHRRRAARAVLWFEPQPMG
jgi:hypothetical protein